MTEHKNDLAEWQPSNLDEALQLTDARLFQPDILSAAVAWIEGNAGQIVADVETAKGRAEINRTARAIGGAIKRFDERRRAYVAELKRQPAEIDKMFRESFRQPAERIKERVRAPLDAWDEEQRAAEEEMNRITEELNAPVPRGTPAASIRERLDATREMALPDWISEQQRDVLAEAIARTVERLTTDLEDAVTAEAQAAELERLRAETAEHERREREAQIAREAEERGRLQGEAAAREQQQPSAPDRKEAEQPAARSADREHQARIHREILADLGFLGLNEEISRVLVSAIARGYIAHLTITY